MTRLTPACIYIVSRIRNSSLSILDIADACETDPFSVGRWYHRISTRLQIELPSERTPSHIVDDCVCRMINETTQDVLQTKVAEPPKKKEVENDDFDDIMKLDTSSSNESDWSDSDTTMMIGKLRQRVSAAVQRVLKMASDQLLISGRHPAPIAAAATWLVLKAYPDTTKYANMAELVKFTHSSARTIEQRVSELKSMLLKQALAVLPWAANLSLQNLEQKLPMVVNHLEAEARVHAAKLKLETLQQEANESNTFASSVFLPVVQSSRKIDPTTKVEEAAEGANGNDQNLLAPNQPSIELFEQPLPTDSVIIQSTLLNQSQTTLVEVKQELTDENENVQTSTAPISTSIALSDSCAIVDPPISQSTTNTSPNSQPKPRFTVKLGPPTLSRYFSSPVTTLSDSNSSQSNPLLASVVIVKPEINENAANDQNAKRESILASEVKKDPNSPSTTPLVHRWSNNKKGMRLGCSFAPAYVKNASTKTLRVHLMVRAKKRLAALARSLSEEDAASFNLLRFREVGSEGMDVISADDSTQQTQDGSQDGNDHFSGRGVEMMDEDSDETILMAAGFKAKPKGFDEEVIQIDKLLMEGATDDEILTGHLTSQLDAHNTHYDAVTEQYTNYEDSLIRTDEEVAIIEQMKAEMGSDDDEEDI